MPSIDHQVDDITSECRSEDSSQVNSLDRDFIDDDFGIVDPKPIDSSLSRTEILTLHPPLTNIDRGSVSTRKRSLLVTATIPREAVH